MAFGISELVKAIKDAVPHADKLLDQDIADADKRIRSIVADTEAWSVGFRDETLDMVEVRLRAVLDEYLIKLRELKVTTKLEVQK